MKKKLAFIAVGVMMFLSCYSPETYDTKEYLAGTGYDSAANWLTDFYNSAHRNALFPASINIVDNRPMSYLILKKPVAVFFREEEIATIHDNPNKKEEDYRIIKLPNIETATKLVDANTLILITYDYGKKSFRYYYHVYDIKRKCYIAGYSISSYSGEYSKPGTKYVVEHADNLLAKANYVTDSSDIVSVWQSYADKIQKLGIDEPNTPLYNAFHSNVAAGSTQVDTAKLSAYDETDVKAFIKMDIADIKVENSILFNIKLSDFSYLPSGGKDWLIVVYTTYKREYIRTLIEKWVKTGETTGRTENVYRTFHNCFIVNGKTGDILTEYNYLSDPDHRNIFPLLEFLRKKK
jgi:hypothetical protein